MNKQFLIDKIDTFLKETELNRFSANNKQFLLYGEPLVGIASADDPMFLKLKEDNVIGSHHFSPVEWFPGAKSVISYFLPFTSEVRMSNRIDKDCPSLEWLYGRIEGESLNNEVRKMLIKNIASSGGTAFVPGFNPEFKIINRRSSWSERHAAYIAGLGTFSLSKSLITEKGTAGRFGSIITDLELEATKRKYTELTEYCSNCGACIKRCPAQAIDDKSKNDELCSNFLDKMKIQFAPRYGCGKCQTKTPCESGIPGRKE
jgi:epoxyqueuosine reductase